MGGISTGIGIFSGIDTRQLIGQLLALEARPKLSVQTRLAQLQQRQGVYLDLNSRLNTLKTAASTFRTGNIFKSMQAASSNAAVLTATADISAAPGTYNFLVDRLVSSQQVLSRGFASRDTGSTGMTSLTIESARARLDRDVSLSDLNGGDGVSRGKIIVTDSENRSATIDLSRAATVGEVLEAINGNGNARVTASVRDGRLVVADNEGGTVRVENAQGYTTATGLGIAGTATGEIVGADVYSLSGATALTRLNDGLGVAIRRQTGEGATSFTIAIDRSSGPGVVNVNVNIGEIWQTIDDQLTMVAGAATTVGVVLQRINAKLDEAGFTDIRAEISSDGKRLQIRDLTEVGTNITVSEASGGTTARDLGLLGSTSNSTLTGRRVLSGINSTLASTLNGGAGLAGDGRIEFQARDGFTFSVDLERDASLDEIMRQIEGASGVGSNGKARISVSLNAKGTGLRITDNTGGASNLIITGTDGDDTAASLGISTGASGVASASYSGSNVQKQYIGRATLLSELNNGRGPGTGTFRITDSTGQSREVIMAATDITVGDLLDKINSRGLEITARINANGDGIELVEKDGINGSVRIKVEEVSGGVARALNLLGTAAGTGSENRINGSYEKTITFQAGDTLQKVAERINAAGAGVTAVIIRDGSGGNPYRLSISGTSGGVAGRFVVDAGDFDLGLTTIERGHDSRVFYGSGDPARAILLSGSSNTLDKVISGVRIDLKSVSAEPVTLTVSRNTEAIEKQADDFVKAFNDLVDRIASQSTYNSDTRRGGPLLGDSLALNFRAALLSTAQSATVGNVGRYSRLAEVGITVGQGGRLQVDTARLREALDEDPGAVEALFTARTMDPARRPEEPERFTQLGIMGQVEQLANRYTNTVDGVFTQRGNTMSNQVRSLNERIAAIDRRLENRRTVLERQFLAMERAVASLQTQQGYLGQIAAIRL